MKTYVTGFIFMTLATIINCMSANPVPTILGITAFVAGVYFGLILGHKNTDYNQTRSQ